MIGFRVSEPYRHRGFSHSYSFFDDEVDLSLLPQSYLQDGRELGMVLVDSANRTWVLRRIWSTGRPTPAWKCLLLTIVGRQGNIVHEVERDYEDQGLTPFAEVRERVCREIDAYPDDWMDEEAMAGEGGVEPLRLEDVMAAAKAGVRNARNIAEIYDALVEACPY